MIDDPLLRVSTVTVVLRFQIAPAVHFDSAHLAHFHCQLTC